MRNILRAVILVLILSGLSSLQAQPGFPTIVTAPNVTVPCGQTCTNLTATALGGATTNIYTVGQITYANPFPFPYNQGIAVSVHTDDVWSSAIPIGWNFCFFGISYGSFIISSNGAVSFNTANAGNFADWSIPGTAPFTSETDMLNTIMAPWQDLDPTNQGNVFYEIGGVAPFRYVQVSWDNCTMYGAIGSVSPTDYCTVANHQTQMAVMYETTNIIEVYIQEKDAPCNNNGNGYWNNGWAIEGIMNNTGTVAYTVPNRNATRFGPLTNDAWRFTPAGAPNYTITWTQNGTTVGTGSTINVCPPAGSTHYVVTASYQNCDNSVASVSTNVFVGLSNLTVADSASQPGCSSPTGAVFATFHSTTGILSYGWAPGGANQTSLTGIAPGTYVFTITDSLGCVKRDTEVLTPSSSLVVTVPNDTANSCSGTTNNGILTANVTGGAPNYSYSWSPGGGVTNPLTGLNVGAYTVTVTDRNGCTGSATGNVSVRTNPLVFASPIITNASCFGGNNGQIIAPLNGGNNPITYTWSSGTGHGDTLSGLIAGTYSVTAVDNNGCSASASFTVGQGTVVTAQVANDTVTSCSGSTNNGTLTAIASGGTPGYTYIWTGNATTNPVTGLNVGTYTVTVSDQNHCTATATASVSVLVQPITFAAPRITNVTCLGGSNGQIIVGINGGTNPITYTWSSGTGHSDTLANIPAGTYTVTAVDANGCSATASYVVTQPLTGISVTVANDTVTSCSGLTNIGILTAVVTGGTPVYSYSWSNTATTNPITGLNTGNYIVTVHDVFGCSATATGNVLTKSSNLSITAQVGNPVCFGLKGQIVVTETGGVFPINYHWSAGQNNTDSLTTDTLSGIGGGTYTITVTDVNGCSVTASYTISQPTALNVTVPNDTITTCSGATTNGTLTASSTGGTPGYSYVWGNNQTTNPITGLSAGTYTVTATDRVGCTASASGSVIVIGNPVVFNQPQITNAGCAGAATGQIILSTTGGTSPITFTWSGGSTQNDTLRNLAGGTYNITATDVNGCSATASYVVNQSAPIVFGTPVITNIGCTGGSNGSITVSTTGGTPTVTYSWSPGGVSGPTITGPAGGYIVTATDANNCTATAAYSISQSAPIAIDSVNIVGVSCTDSGSISVLATGGTGTLTYKWNPGNLTGNSITGISAGGYTLTVTDINGCSTTAHYIVGHAPCGACPAVTTNNNVVIPCSQTCTLLMASAFSAMHTDVYSVAQIAYNPPFAFNTGTAVLVHTDDLWSSVINLPFNFCFFGLPYNKIIIGSNGEVSFNTNNAGGLDNWSIPGPVPFANANTEQDQRNTIMAPWQDLDPTHHGDIYWNITGTAPCRKFEVSWYDSPMFGDSNSVDNGYCDSTDHQTQMIVLYETTNDIDIFIHQKDVVCNNNVVSDPSGTYWNGGLAIEGIVNPTMTVAYTVPGRNATQWSAHNDAWRFSPAGTPNFTIQWFQNGNLISSNDTVTVCPVVPTTYTVLATYTNCDNSQVIVGDSVYVTPGGTLTSRIDSTRSILCYGDSDGAVYASYSTNGTVTSFGWNYPGGANQTSLVGIPAGTYIFTVTTTTCTKSDTVVLVNPSRVVVTVPNDTFTSCSANNLGTLSAGVTGGTAGYTYLWSNGSTTAAISGLTPGTYSVIVTDSHGCTGSATATVTRLQGNLAFGNPVVVQPTCTTPGAITVTVTGGTLPITYTWSPTEPNTGILTGLTAGSYCVTATDAGGCSVTACFTLTQAVSVTIDSANVTNVTCNAANNGTITVHASGGTPPLGYSWTPTEPNSNSLTGLSAGTYVVTVTDASGCTATASYTITQPSAIANDSVVIVAVTCTASGSVTVFDTGGVAPLTYSWSNGSTTDSITNVPAGTYTLTVTDAHGCSITASYVVGTAPGAIVFGTPVIVNTTCNGDSTGSITVSATGGNGNISYTWSNGATTATISNLPAGTYVVTASDNGGCSGSASYTVGQPTAVTFGNPVITNVSCNGSSNGSIVANANGGTGHITYSWSVPNVNGDTLSGLTAGVYCVTATDSVGCSASICYSVSQPTPVVVDSSHITSVTCVAPGHIILFVSGGTGSYSYQWTGATGGDTATVTGAGTVTVVVTDANGCTDTASFVVNAAIGAVTIGTPVISPVTCNGNSNGSITVVATDSAGGPITFAWSTGATSATITGLAAGQYCVTATDSLGCSASACYNLTNPAAITFGTPVLVNPSCNGSANGSITANASGGTGMITYTWPGPVVGATDTALIAGSYIVTATDSLGCSATASYTLTQPTAVSLAGSTSTNVTCNGANNGSINLVVSGGTPGYTYAWTNGATGATPSGLSPNTYCVTVSDANGCSATACYTITEPTPVVIDTAVIHEATCVTGGTVVLTVSGGTPGYTYHWSSNASVVDSAVNIAAGNISVTVTDGHGCSITATYVVPAAPNTVVIDSGHVVNDICNGGATGSITVTATGGIGSLHYGWSTPPGGATNSITGLAAGTYTITVTDSLGCSASASYAVTQPNAIVIDSVVSHQVTCTSQGSLVIYAHGGTGAYGYTWQNSNVVIDSLGNLSAGIYGFTITDANGCTKTGSGTVTTAPNSIALSFDSVQPACNGFSNGSVTVNATGGSGGFTYLWSNGGTTATISGLATGTYCVTVHDSNGCSKNACDSLPQPTVLAVSLVPTQATCNQAGSILANVTGGTPVYHYLWSNTTTANPVTGLAGGTTEGILVTDANGCTVASTITLNPAPAPLTITDSTITEVKCNGGNTGSINFTLTGGSGGNVTYVWNPNTVTGAPPVNNLVAGTYSVTVTDGGGCSFTDSWTITQPGPYTATIVAPGLVCPGATDTATVLVAGAQGTPGYLWSNTGTTQTVVVTGLTTTATTVSVTVTDGVGCTVTASKSLAAAAQIVDTAEVVPHPCAGGGTVTIVATGGTGALTYDYSPGGTPGSTGALGNLPSNDYTFTIHDTLGCSVTGTFIVPPSAPADVYTSKADSASCFGFADGKIIITEDSLQNAPFTYSINGGAFRTSNEFDSLAAGIYTVVVENTHGCTDTILDTVGQPLQVMLSFSPDTVQGVANYATPLNPNVVNAINPVYAWTPATGLSCTNCADPTATLQAPQLYYLTVSDSLNPKCAVTDSVWVLLKGPLLMPDAFTPNGDGKNDLFGPISHVYVIVKEFHIYNRWGQLVHNSTSYWDGKFDGKEQPSGTYIYYIEGQYEDPSNPGNYITGKQEGAVTLLR